MSTEIENNEFGQQWRILSKTESESKETISYVEVIQINRVGCLVQSTTLHEDFQKQTLVFVPGVKVRWADETKENGGRLVSIKKKKKKLKLEPLE